MKNIFYQNGRVYLITDRAIAGISHFEIARQAMRAGVRTIQVREKNLPRARLFEEAVLIRKVTRRYGATFIINDYVDIAMASGADGVHLGQDDLPVKEARRILGKGKIIGISAHSLEQAREAQRDGADYVGFGPVFRTLTKDAGRPKGTGSLRKIRPFIRIPVVAIGGINAGNVRDVLDAGADAVAVASSVLSGKIRDNVKELFRLLR